MATTKTAQNINRFPDLICSSMRHFEVNGEHLKFTSLFCEAKSLISESDQDIFKIAKMAYDEAQTRTNAVTDRNLPLDSFSIVTAGSEMVIHYFKRIPGHQFLLRTEIFKSNIVTVNDLVQTFKACWALRTMLEDLHDVLERKIQTPLQTPKKKFSPMLPSISLFCIFLPFHIS